MIVFNDEKCVEPKYQERRKISTKRMKRDYKRRRAFKGISHCQYIHRELRKSFTINRRTRRISSFSLESFIESPLQPRNEFVEELVYKGGEGKKERNKGWREREKTRKKGRKSKKKKKKTSIRCRLWYTYTTCVRRPVRATRLRQWKHVKTIID